MWTHRFAILTARATFTLMLIVGTLCGARSSLLVTLCSAITGQQEAPRATTDEMSWTPECWARSVVASQGGVA